MQPSKIFRPLGIIIVLSLLTVLIPAKPALAAPVTELSPAFGAIGTRVTVTGTNFGSYIGDNLHIFFNDMEIADSPKIVPDSGNFEAYFDVPDDTGSGVSWITVKGPLGSVLARASFTVTQTEIELDVREGYVGTTVSITGQGFYSNKIVAIYYYFNGVVDKLGTVVASPIGECSYNLVIPASTAGKHKIVVENAQGNSARDEFVVIPSATLKPTSGIADDVISVSGTGFAGSTEIEVFLRTHKVAYSKTDENGSFKGAFKVPLMKSGSYDVKIEDKAGNIYRLEFAIAANARLERNAGHVGMELIVSGTGFVAGGQVTIKYDELKVAETTADDTGVFSATFDVPVSTSGSHSVTVSDGTNTRQLAFTMESKAPPAPNLLLPEKEADVEQPLALNWELVNDPSSPVTYDLEVASDDAFTVILLQKQGLTEARYTLTEEEEKLKPTRKGSPYYWRVKAVDSASNASVWSKPGTFYIASAAILPTWAIIVLVVISVLIVIFLVWRVRRETTYE